MTSVLEWTLIVLLFPLMVALTLMVVAVAVVWIMVDQVYWTVKGWRK